MKIFITLTLLLFTSLVHAQRKAPVSVTTNSGGPPGSDVPVRICVPSRASSIANAPLYIIKSHHQEVKSSATKLYNIDTKWIKSIDVSKDSIVLAKYGGQAKNGVFIITLDDEKFPNAFEQWKAAKEHLNLPANGDSSSIRH